MRWKSDAQEQLRELLQCHQHAGRSGAQLRREPQLGAHAADMEIELEHRIVLSPFAAKRLNQLLSKLITEYETRYGELK